MLSLQLAMQLCTAADSKGLLRIPEVSLNLLRENRELQDVFRE